MGISNLFFLAPFASILALAFAYYFFRSMKNRTSARPTRSASPVMRRKGAQ